MPICLISMIRNSDFASPVFLFDGLRFMCRFLRLLRVDEKRCFAVEVWRRKILVRLPINIQPHLGEIHTVVNASSLLSSKFFWFYSCTVNCLLKRLRNFVVRHIGMVGFVNSNVGFLLLRSGIMNFCVVGSERGEPRTSNVVRSGAPQQVLPIETPVIPLDELNRLTGNFGTKSFIGEGSYGRVYYATLKSGQAAAIKKLDTSSSPEPDTDFAAQVRYGISMTVGDKDEDFSILHSNGIVFLCLSWCCSYHLFLDLSKRTFWS